MLNIAELNMLMRNTLASLNASDMRIVLSLGLQRRILVKYICFCFGCKYADNS